MIGHYMPRIAGAGGVGSYIGRIARAQAELGHEVLLIDRVGSGTGSEDGPIVLTTDDADLFRLALDRRLDILHLHTVVDTSHPSVKTIRTMHGHWPYCPSGSRFFGRQSESCDRRYSLIGCAWGHVVDRCGSVRPAEFAGDFRRTWKEMRAATQMRTLAISEFVKSQMIRSGNPAANIHVLHLPAPELLGEQPSSAPDGIASFVFMGRLVVQKGVEWLLRAAAAVTGEFRLEIAGEGPLRGQLEKLAGELGLGRRVIFHGWVQEPRSMAMMAQARAVVFPSVWPEPAGLITLEAAATGRPVIASRVGGIPEYARMLGNAVLVEPHDVPALARAMQGMLDDPLYASRMGGHGRTAARGILSLKEHLRMLDDHYTQVSSSATSR